MAIVNLNGIEVEHSSEYRTVDNALGGESNIFVDINVENVGKEPTYEYMVNDIQHVYLSNKPTTLVEIYRREKGEKAYTFYTHEQLNGTIKRASTVLRKLKLNVVSEIGVKNER